MWGIFSIIKGPTKQDLLPNTYYIFDDPNHLFGFDLGLLPIPKPGFGRTLHICRLFLKIWVYFQAYILSKNGKTWFQKKKFRLQYKYRNWTLVSVPDTETWFWSYISCWRTLVLVREVILTHLGKYPSPKSGKWGKREKMWRKLICNWIQLPKEFVSNSFKNRR